MLTNKFGTEVKGQLERSTLGSVHLVAEWSYRHDLMKNGIYGCG